ncbi:MAG: class II fructose-bisphosphatase [Alphaproteobacteria bacterium]|nr:class II fructose-bisphosphatase [Alphaproteobacteria bacterium]
MDNVAPPDPSAITDRNLALELVRVTEAAALAASRWIGRGQKNEADGAAVEAMRKAFDQVAIEGTVVIGEGEMDEAPMLYIGEKVGQGGPAMDIAVDPLEGTTITAKGGPNALATVALAEHGNFLHAPDIYMDKIAVGGGLPEGVVDLDASPGLNLRNLAQAKRCSIADLVVCILERDRHKEIIAKCREAGARIMLIGDGDVAGVIATACRRSSGDCWQIERARGMGISDPRRKYNVEEMAAGDVMFAATGVTSGSILQGVRRVGHGAITHSMVMRSKSGTVRYVEAHHNFDRKTWSPSS